MNGDAEACRGDRRGLCMAVIAGTAELDLNVLARVTGDRKVDTIAFKELQPLTGFIRGGVTVIRGKKVYPAFACESITRSSVVSVRAGVRGTQMLLSPADYLRVTRTKLSPISRAKAAGA